MVGYLKCEYIKIRKKYDWLYVILFVLANIYVSSVLAGQVYNSQKHTGHVAKVPLGRLAYTFNSNNFYMYGLPFLIVIFLAMYFHMESENDGWKLVKISGGNMRKALYAKFIIAFLFLLYVYSCQLLVTLAYEIIYDIPILNLAIFLDMGLSLLGAMLNCTFLFLIFLLINSVVINIVIGILGLILNTIIIQTHYWKYIFTTYYYNVYSVTGKEQLEIALICAVGIFLLILVIRNCKKV